MKSIQIMKILLDVVGVTNETGSEAETKKLVQSLENLKINLSEIIACAFDTTAANSGLNKGLVVQVYTALQLRIFQMACHHIFELVNEAIR